MKESKYLVLLFLTTFLLSCAIEKRIDDKPKQDSCIVSLVPSITDFLGEISPDRVVAVSNFCDASFLPDSINRISTFPQIKYERLLDYKECNVFVLEGFINSEQSNRISQLGLNVIPLTDRKIEDILELPVKIDSVKGLSLSHKLKEHFNHLLSEKIAVEQSYLIMIGNGLQVYGNGNYLTELIDTLGFANIARNVAGAYPELKSEYFLENLPNYIVTADSVKLKKYLRAKFSDDDLTGLNTVKFVQIQQNILFRPNHRFLEVGEKMINFATK